MSLRATGLFCCGVLCVALLAFSCSEPLERDTFVRSDQAVQGVYSFDIDFPDTLSVYDVFIYSSLSEPETPLHNVQLSLMWLSPDGQTFRETVWFRQIGPRGDKELYRSGFSVSREGTWRLSVCPAAEAQGRISGIGVICRKNGTR